MEPREPARYPEPVSFRPVRAHNVLGGLIVVSRPFMDKTIARLNIGHFRRKLAEETDRTKRQILLRLLAEEEAKLAALDHSPGDVPKDNKKE